MKMLTVDEFDRLSRRPHTVVAEGKEIKTDDGSLTPVVIKRKGFRTLSAMVFVPKEEPPAAPTGWDRAEPGPEQTAAA